MFRDVSIASAPHPPYPRSNRLVRHGRTMFQSHLRLIHPIHEMKFIWSKCSICFNRICASSTLSTSHFRLGHNNRLRFQSHLRLIHPIHLESVRVLVKAAMFQSHLRLIHPIHMCSCSLIHACTRVSIASAPHPPYPRSYIFHAYCQDSFQSHLRLIHPIHTHD